STPNWSFAFCETVCSAKAAAAKSMATSTPITTINTVTILRTRRPERGLDGLGCWDTVSLTLALNRFSIICYDRFAAALRTLVTSDAEDIVVDRIVNSPLCDAGFTIAGTLASPGLLSLTTCPRIPRGDRKTVRRWR